MMVITLGKCEVAHIKLMLKSTELYCLFYVSGIITYLIYKIGNKVGIRFDTGLKYFLTCTQLLRKT